MVADAFNHRLDPAIAHTEAFTSRAMDIGLARGSAIKGDIAYDNILPRHEGRVGRRIDHQFRARQPLTEIVIGVALDLQCHPLGGECGKALTGGSLKLETDRILGQAHRAIAPRNLRTENGPGNAVDILDR